MCLSLGKTWSASARKLANPLVDLYMVDLYLNDLYMKHNLIFIHSISFVIDV